MRPLDVAAGYDQRKVGLELLQLFLAVRIYSAKGARSASKANSFSIPSYLSAKLIAVGVF